MPLSLEQQTDNVRRVINYYTSKLGVSISEFAANAGADATHLNNFMLGSEPDLNADSATRVADLIGDLAQAEEADVNDYTRMWGPNIPQPLTALDCIIRDE